MLETFTLKQQYMSMRQELAQALYQHDGACRVIARLTKERDAAREALANLKASSNVQDMEVEQEQVQEDVVVPSSVSDKMNEVFQEYSLI